MSRAQVGDVDGCGTGTVTDPGKVWVNDKYRWGQAFLSHEGDQRYDECADLNEDGVVDFEDAIGISANWGKQKEYGGY